MATQTQPEARSLSTINYLAANPPQYPYQPEVRESLTLYISRVPGTQDIILSTFRPQRKNVTSEDVANSLYYFHLGAPQNPLLAVPPQPDTAVSPRSSSESARSAIRRKPLPTSAKVLRPEGGAVTSSEPHQPLAAPPAFIPVAPASSNRLPQQSHGEPLDDVVEGYRENPMFHNQRAGGRRESGAPKLPPRPAPPATIRQGDRTPPGARGPAGHGDKPSAAFGTILHRRPVAPTQPATRTANLDAQPVQITAAPSSSDPGRTPSPGISGRSPSSLSFSLTMIRRDPASGAQWNIGKVTSFQTNVPTPDSADPSLDPENMGGLLSYTHKIDIHLETAGYAKYRDMPSRADVNAHRPTSVHSFAQQMTQGPVSGSGPKGDQASMLRPAWMPAEEGFSRRVVMSYSASWTLNIKKAFQRRERSGSRATVGGASPEESASRFFHSRHGSTSTVGSADSIDERHPPTLITHPGPGLKPRGYTFQSPWNGRCEFRTSANGRGLKCRHVLDPAEARLDPREVAQSIRDAQAMGRPRGDELSSALVGAKPVSELRFNLPGRSGQNTASRDGEVKDANPVSVRLSKLFHHRSQSSEDESEDEGDDDDEYVAMDLSLGKENAGGGNRGKRAKLGKLIIHDEGLKMLDLVVAANVGVWWTTWGRNL
ncbi:hypothetical protein N658DRAFT_490088 [Parathielavia hyrcaniae]|uniref:Oxidoreductase-like protein n=1 Tax=Parathielavia hyrcaniae TaxID=113614 RepID=A0AAN6SWU3_9PEZI|nr:hypothetical protein N658DRAFT_490088 [Parathielavia hyrcaniae]